MEGDDAAGPQTVGDAALHGYSLCATVDGEYVQMWCKRCPPAANHEAVWAEDSGSLDDAVLAAARHNAEAHTEGGGPMSDDVSTVGEVIARALPLNPLTDRFTEKRDPDLGAVLTGREADPLAVAAICEALGVPADTPLANLVVLGEGERVLRRATNEDTAKLVGFVWVRPSMHRASNETPWVVVREASGEQP